ncbi:SPOR domain-containing protein [Sphingobium subterraneum]|nr:SPOR domain-containing protein [Sphingobium subterraneum]
MKHFGGILAIMAATTTLAFGAAPAWADVKAGVDAWTQGDYARAIDEWRPLAESGDADAQFNMGQAYKLGRGVPTDLTTALGYYRKAAAQGHQRAEDNIGLILFQQGNRSEAMPTLQKSADRGEPRAQYLVGTALFNGDLLPKNWVRAYAMMTRASSAGLTQARNSLAQMDQYIPEAQRKEGLALAAQWDKQPSSTVMASAAPASTSPKAPVARPAPAPIRTTDLPPSTPPAASDSGRGTTYAPPPVSGIKPSAPAPAPAPKPAPAMPAATPSAPTSGTWRIQLGAFSEEARANALWTSLSTKVRGLSAYQPYLVKGDGITRLQAGPLPGQTEAIKLCTAIKATGNPCIPKGL